MENQEAALSDKRVDLLMKEYDALRAEIGSALSFRLQVWSYGSAALGILAAGALAADGSHTAEVGWVLCFVLPALSFAVFHTWLSEVMRGRRASCHLWGVERHVNALVGARVLRWEEDLRDPPRVQARLFRGHYLSTLVWFGTVAVYGAFRGAGLIFGQGWLQRVWILIVAATFLFARFRIRFSQWDEPAETWPERQVELVARAAPPRASS